MHVNSFLVHLMRRLGCYPVQCSWALFQKHRHFISKTKKPVQTREKPGTLRCGFFQSDDSFQFTKDSGQGSEKSGWLIHSYDFTLQRAREKRSDTAES